MTEDAAKPFLSNMAVSDVFMPVDMRVERRLGIVGMDHWNVVDPQDAIDFGYRFFETGRCR